MSDNSARWPGPDGSPGIQFTPHSASATEVVDEPRHVASPAHADETRVHAAIPEEPAAAETTRVVRPITDHDEREFGGDEAQPSAQSAPDWAFRPGDEREPDGSLSPPARALPAHEPTVVIGSGASPAPAAAAVAAGSAVGAAAAPSRPGPRPLTSRRTRKARLRLARIDPWSVMKTAFLFSIAFGIMMMVVAWVLWSVFAGSGALESLNQFLTTLIADQDGGQFQIENWINGSRVLGFAALVAAIDVVILTAVATLFAFLYNLAATVIGGLEITLAED